MALFSFDNPVTSFENTITQCGNFIIFPLTQILREINFGNSTSAKSAFLAHLVALNYDLNEFLHFLKAEIYQIKCRASKMAKTAVLELLDFPNLISRKIYVLKKS